MKNIFVLIFLFISVFSYAIDTVWIRNSSSNLWWKPYQISGQYYFTPEDSVMLTYFDGQTAKFKGYVYNLNNQYYPVQMGDTIHVSISVYGHRTNVIGIEDDKPKPALNIYPNPSSDEVYIELDPAFGQCNIELFDMHGGLIYRMESNNEIKHFINTRCLPEALYLLRVHNAENSVIKKLIVSH